MKSRGLRYAFRDGFVGLFRHPLVLIASITTMMMLLFLTAGFFAFSANVNHLVDIAGQQPPIEIMFKPNANEAMVRQLDDSLEQSKEVVYHQLYTPEENFENFKRNIGREELYEGFDYRQRIPFTIQVRLEDPALADQFKNEVVQNPTVQEVYLEQALMSFLDRLKVQVNFVSIIIFVALTLITVFIISNMTRVAALARSFEINIMKYIGATNAYIRIPFIVQGMIVGFISALVAGASFVALYLAVFARLQGNILAKNDFNLLEPWHILPTCILLVFALGISLGGVTSALSVRKHAKV